MNARMVSLLLVVSAVICGTSAAPAAAQGLIWSLPEEGAWVRFEGAYSYIERREGSPVQEIAPWTKHLTIKSLGSETREVKGETVSCRWIEIIVTTGRATEEGLAPGPLGTWKYQVLVPESAVPGDLVDEGGIPTSMLPVFEGRRKLGNRPLEPITSGVLQVYPVITLLEHYRQWAGEADEPADPGIKLGAVEAMRRTASLVVESRRFRSTNTAELWLSEDVPFGLAKWKVTVEREEKDAIQPRSTFQPASELIEEMEAVASGADAMPDADFPAPGE